MTLSRANIIRFCCWGLILVYIVSFSYTAMKATFMGGDFPCFYASSQILLSGDTTGMYDLAKISVIEQQVTGDADMYSLGWYYPPVFLLVISPLAKLPYNVSLFLWLAVTLAGYVLVVRKIAPHPLTAGLILAYAGTYKNIVTGQNGFLTALLLGQGLLLLERRPALAGVILGLLIYKPHLAVLIVLALAAGRQWRALLAAGAAAATLAGVSLALYGAASWEAFLHTLPLVKLLLEIGALPWSKMTSFFALARLLGGSVPLAYGLQAISTVVAFGSVYWVWRKGIFPLAYIVLTISVFLATPYAFNYDLSIIGLSLAWYGWEVYKKGWLPYEKIVLLLAWFMPVISVYVGMFTNIQMVPVVLTAMLVLALRRRYVQTNPGKQVWGDISFLNAKLVRYCAWSFVFAYLITLGGFWLSAGSTDPVRQERFMGGGFPLFYASAQKLTAGDAAGVYELPDVQESERQSEQKTVERSNYVRTGDYYPPVFFLSISCLTALPYLAALFAWLAGTLAGYVLVVRKIVPHPCTVGVALAFPGTFQNLIQGQSGFFSALLLGQGLLLLEQHPATAGLILGLLVYKPHIAVLTGIALAAGRKWRTLAAACVSAAAMIVISIYLYGPAGWQAFYHVLPAVRHALETGAIPRGSMPTLFVAARLLQFDVPWAYAFQAVLAVAAVAGVAWVWRRQVCPLAYAVLAIGIFLVTPYAYQYDLSIAGLGIAWYGWEGLAKGWLPYEKTVLLFAWLLPAISGPIVRLTNIQLIPVVLLMLLVLALRRRYAVAELKIPGC